ncbi:hypothetical protein CEXT_808941 [Caerostris extrusa]|uniref:Uncharacterized protein n=1 Tax=Caerostris extrusa TaxID=172846 RepID=A0AAV4W3S5_CAEEX|nr:hypothetical protein CEXT_808941 [Caerostris extrusa]
MPTGDTAIRPLLYPQKVLRSVAAALRSLAPSPQSRARIRLGRPRTFSLLQTRLGCEKVPRNMHSEELKRTKRPKMLGPLPNGGHLTPSRKENPNFLVYKKGEFVFCSLLAFFFVLFD